VRRRHGELQRYFDGELSPRRARRVHEQLEAQGPEGGDCLRLEAMGQIRGMLRSVADATADDADFSGLWGEVARRTTRVTGPSRKRGWLRLVSWAAVAASAAAAIVLAFALRSGSTPTSNECMIESLDVGPGAVSTIFTIEDPDLPGGTTVIWISDRDAEGAI